MGEMERRVSAARLEIREEGDGPVIVGYAAVFGEWSQDLGGFVETILPGFFAPTLDQDVRALWQHDPLYVLGRTTNETLALEEDDRGLRVRIVPPESGWARDAVVSLRRGDVSQMSFAFAVERELWEPVQNGLSQRTLVTARALYDVSPVTFPAYPQTSVAVRQTVERLRAEAGHGQDAAEAEARARERLRLRVRTREK